MWRRFGIVAVMVTCIMAMAGCASDKDSVTLPEIQVDGTVLQDEQSRSDEKPEQVSTEDSVTENVTEEDAADETMDEEVFEVEDVYGGGGGDLDAEDAYGGGSGVDAENAYGGGNGGFDVDVEFENPEAMEQAYEEYMQHTQDLQHEIVNGNAGNGEQTIAPGNNSY